MGVDWWGQIDATALNPQRSTAIFAANMDLKRIVENHKAKRAREEAARRQEFASKKLAEESACRDLEKLILEVVEPVFNEAKQQLIEAKCRAWVETKSSEFRGIELITYLARITLKVSDKKEKDENVFQHALEFSGKPFDHKIIVNSSHLGSDKNMGQIGYSEVSTERIKALVEEFASYAFPS